MSPRPLLPLLCLALAAGPAAKPPATKPAAPRTDDLVSLGDDVVRFHAPPAPHWAIAPAAGDATADRIVFITDDRTAEMQVEFATFQVDAATAGQVGVGLAKALKEKRQKAGNALVLAPTVERDKRFDLVIHEKFKVGDAVEDELHLFKSVGPKTVMVALSTTASDPAVVKQTLEAGRVSIASAKYNKPAAAASKAKPTRP